MHKNKISNKEKIISLIKKRGLIKAKDLKSLNVSRNYLYKLTNEGILTRVSKGVYTLPEITYTEKKTFAEVTKKVPKAVICLISSLVFHNVTTQISNQIWIMLPTGSWNPKIKDLSLNVTYTKDDLYKKGIEKHTVNGVEIKVYNLAKTVVDCFKHRNKIGLDVAIEALQEIVKNKKCDLNEILTYAKINRVYKIMRPYLEMIS